MTNVIPLRPLPTKPGVKTYWHCAGTLFHNAGGRGVPITVHEAHRLRDLYAREAHRCHPSKLADHAAALFVELTQALDELDTWARCVGRPSPWASDQIEDALAARKLEQVP